MPAKPLARKAPSRTAARDPGRKPARKPGAAKAVPRGGKRAMAKGKGRVAGKPPSARKQGPEAVRAHFATFPPARREAMLKLWDIVQDALPGSSSVVSYGIAIAWVGGRWVVGVGSGKAHVGLYLMSPAFVQEHAADLAGQDVSGGMVRFPLGKPLPAALVRRLVRMRLVSLGQPFGADEARMKPSKPVPKPAAMPRPTPLDRFPKPLVVPLDGSRS